MRSPPTLKTPRLELILGRLAIFSKGSLRLGMVNVALRHEQGEELIHVLQARAKVHWIDAKPAFSFELGGRNPETAALLDSLGDFSV